MQQRKTKSYNVRWSLIILPTCATCSSLTTHTHISRELPLLFTHATILSYCLPASLCSCWFHCAFQCFGPSLCDSLSLSLPLSLSHTLSCIFSHSSLYLHVCVCVSLIVSEKRFDLVRILHHLCCCCLLLNTQDTSLIIVFGIYFLVK